MNLDLKNKVIIYTGAAGLIGEKACKELAKKETKLILVDPNYEALLALKKELSYSISSDDIMIFSDISITDAKSIDNLLNKIMDKFSKIDCLINCAYPKTPDWSAKFEDIPMQSWQENIDCHLNGYFLMSQRTANRMILQKFGNIINFSSIYGIVGPNFNIYPDTMTMPAAYSAIKGGISNFTKYLASYLGKYNIRVNSICPGGIKDVQTEFFITSYESIVPLRRMANVQDIIGPLLFLVSDLSSYITGTNLVVDGGWTAI